MIFDVTLPFPFFLIPSFKFQDMRIEVEDWSNARLYDSAFCAMNSYFHFFSFKSRYHSLNIRIIKIKIMTTFIRWQTSGHCSSTAVALHCNDCNYCKDCNMKYDPTWYQQQCSAHLTTGKHSVMMMFLLLVLLLHAEAALSEAEKRAPSRSEMFTVVDKFPVDPYPLVDLKNMRWK